MLRDLAPKAAREEWAAARKAETQYGIALRKIARHVGHLIRGFDLDNEHDAALLAEALQRYATLLNPWARSAARRMVAEVSARSDVQWRKVAAEMGANFRELFGSDDQIGLRYRQLQAEQVELITSIPRDAGLRVHELIRNGVLEGKRFTEIVPEIQRGGEVSKSKANLIARTETGRVVTNLTQARSESIGSEGYTWRTVRDAQVRPSHRAMEGKFVRWDQPPTLDGITGHAGAQINCRCFPEPSLPMVFKDRRRTADRKMVAEELKTLYVHRKLLNPESLIAWARGQGFKSTLPADDIHVTVCFSKAPVNWAQFKPEADVDIYYGTRSIEQFGDAIILEFSAAKLEADHDRFMAGGASFDFDRYRPHVTITYDRGDVDIAAVTPYAGSLKFGPEIFAEVNLDWEKDVKELVA